MNVYRSVDGQVATFTVSNDYADHRFEVVRGDDSVSVDYQESQIGRGTITTVDPPDEIYDELTNSRQFADFVSEW